MFDNNSYTVAQNTLKATPKMANYIKDVYDSGKNSATKRSIKMNDRRNNMTDPSSPFADRIDKQIEDQMDKKLIMAANQSPNSLA